MSPSGAQPVADDSLSLRLGGGPDAAATARGALARLRADIDPPLMETLRLLVTELVTNSVQARARRDGGPARARRDRPRFGPRSTDEGPGFDPTNTGAPREDRSGLGALPRRAARRPLGRRSRGRRHQGLVRASARLAPLRFCLRPLQREAVRAPLPGGADRDRDPHLRARMRRSVRRGHAPPHARGRWRSSGRKRARASVILRAVPPRRTRTVNCAFARAPFGPVSFQTNARRLLELGAARREAELRVGSAEAAAGAEAAAV